MAAKALQMLGFRVQVSKYEEVRKLIKSQLLYHLSYTPDPGG